MEIVEDVDKKKRCLIEGNLECLKENLQDFALVKWSKAASRSTGAQHKLYNKMWNKDYEALQQLKPLKNGNIIGATSILCNMFDYKAREIKQFLANIKPVIN